MDKIIAALPPGLISLYMDLHIGVPYTIKELPSGLQSLVIVSHYNQIKVDVFPRSLRRFHITHKHHCNLYPSDVCFFPDGLTDFRGDLSVG
jgi:hypothetical protein